MAEIRVEPKRGGARWLWVVIALVVVALLAWYFLNRRDATAPATGSAARGAPALAWVAPAGSAGSAVARLVA